MTVAGIGPTLHRLLFAAPPTASFAAMCLLLWLSLLVIVAMTMLGSTVVRSVVAAGAIGFGAYIVLAIVSALPSLGPLTPAGLQNAAATVAGGGPAPDVALAALANIGIVVGAGVVAWLVLRRQEL